MSTKFFNNLEKNTLFEKFRGIASAMGCNLHTFQAVSGFFRSSGYFKLRSELINAKKIQILVGINIDNIFKNQKKGMLFLGDPGKAKTLYTEQFVDDVRDAKYTAEIETGMLQFCEDIIDGRVEIRIHPSKNLHAKFYLFLPESYSSHTDGWVIMGSSNISESGLGITKAPQYELNISMKDYDDVSYCKGQFQALWQEGIPLTSTDIADAKNVTHLASSATPYQLYMKVLIDTFGELAEDDFMVSLPEGVVELKYQKDAVVQGYQMLCKYNGFFLADVVGLGKTVVAALIAKRFVEANGKKTAILVIYPPAVESNWRETFEKVGLRRQTQFISNGSLSKVLEGKNNYKSKEEFDLIIVDESHNFRRSDNQRYDELQRICKAPRSNQGIVGGRGKRIILVSATPLNNYPEDLLNQILLFQDSRRSTIDGVANLQAYFLPKINQFKEIMRKRKKIPQADLPEIDALYSDIQRDVLAKITIRRTRRNILNDPGYAKDLKVQGIQFPEVSKPEILRYTLAPPLDELFWDTIDVLGGKLHYARYRAIEFLNQESTRKYRNPQQVADILTGIYRVHMVKRLESSFHAFKQSIKTFIRITTDMINMFRDDKVLIIPELNVKDLQGKGWEIDRIIEYAVEKHGYTKEDIVYPAKAFSPEFLKMLDADLQTLQVLDARWELVTSDPKLDLFIESINTKFFEHRINQTGKLVVFSESVDTLNYLERHLKRSDLLKVCSKNCTASLKNTIRECFDANHEKKSDCFNIILTSDVLAEGINLHRANVIVNYDTPWNATRLMQRVGRVNRIGSTEDKIHSFLFYPSDEGNEVIGLYENALLKIQSFHSALGEDVQIYSPVEVLKEFELFDSNVKDSVDQSLEYLREVRHLYQTDKKLYEKIRDLPLKSRVIRKGKAETSVVYISSSRKKEYFKVENNRVEVIGFLEAAALLKASRSEKSMPADSVMKKRHFSDVCLALDEFEHYAGKNQGDIPLGGGGGRALKFLRGCHRWRVAGLLSPKCCGYCESLSKLIECGRFTKLERKINELAKKHTKRIDDESADRLEKDLQRLYTQYVPPIENVNFEDSESEPLVVVSETFFDGGFTQ